MNDTIDLLERLLYEAASDTLIFKPKEYKLKSALVLEQGELLRDVLGVINAWRRSDTYILVGVDGVPGGKGNVLGVMEHLDSGELETFVNSKTEQRVALTYTPLEYKRRKLGILHIPLQPRPVYLKDNFANLKKYVVYVRRGGQVVEADTEEVAKMKQNAGGGAGPAPSLSLAFAQGLERKILGKRIIVKTFLIDVPAGDIIPDYTGPVVDPMTDFLPDGSGVVEVPINRDYFRDLAVYYRRFGRVSKIDFALSNPGAHPVFDVDLEINVEDENGDFYFYEATDLPHLPAKTRMEDALKPLLTAVDPAVAISRVPPWWTIVIHFNQVPAKGAAYTTGGVYMGSKIETVLDCEAALHAGGQGESTILPLTIEFKTQEQKVGLESLTKMI